MTRISVFGIGYVGTTTAACLADLGHEVIGIDIDHRKVKLINEGKSPITEKPLVHLIRKCRNEGKLSATTDSIQAVRKTDVSVITVGTPTRKEQTVDLHSVFNVFQNIGEALRWKNDYHTVILRSTVPPGTTMNGLKLVGNVSGKELGSDFGGCMNPEFLREGSMVKDFNNPPYVIIGQYDQKSGDVAAKLYEQINAEIIRTKINLAEMLKYVCNSFHALKVSFANEIGRLSKKMRIDARQVMDLFVKDKKLNLSSCYLNPGFAFGGPCLPKDLKAIIGLGKREGLRLPLLESILTSNDSHIDYTLSEIEKMERNRVALLGLTYKEKVADLRESPVIALLGELLERGYSVSAYDDLIDFKHLTPSNKSIVENLPFDLEKCMVSSLSELVESADIILIASRRERFKQIGELISDDKFIFDISGLFGQEAEVRNYKGICW